MFSRDHRGLWNGLRLLLCATVVALLPGCNAPPKSTTGAGGVSVEAVHRFVAAWQNWSPADSACDALRPYWDAPAPGLAIYRHQLHVDFDDLCAAVHRRPEDYAQLTSRLAELDSVAAAVRDVYSRFNVVVTGGGRRLRNASDRLANQPHTSWRREA